MLQTARGLMHQGSIMLFVLLLFTAGCGYHAVGGASLPNRHFTVAIPLSKNASYLPGAEGVVASALRDSAIREGLEVLESAKADLTLTADVASFTIESSAFSALDRSELYQAAMGLSVEIVDTRKNQLLLREQFHERGNFPAQPLRSRQQNVEDALLKELAERASATIIHRLISIQMENRK